MDLVDKIEKNRFLGREFLVWLWFESELTEGRFEVEGFGPAEIWLDSQLTLALEKEQSRLKGVAPSAAPEAREALRQGKLPTSARVRVSRGDLEYAFALTADTIALSAVKIPNVVKEESDEQFYERMYLVEELEALFGALYGRFLGLRLSPAWESGVVAAIRDWVHDRPVDDAAYRLAVKRVPPLGRTQRPATVPPPAAAPETLRNTG